MAHYNCFAVLLVVLTPCIVLQTSGFESFKDEDFFRGQEQQTLNLIEHPFDHLRENSWLHKAIFPEYMENFLKLLRVELQDSNDFDTVVAENLFKGLDNINCKAHVLEWIRRAFFVTDVKIASEEEKWVLQMIDSWGKFPEGILTGHVNAYGDFNECVEIEVSKVNRTTDMFMSASRNFEGRYCTTYMGDYATAKNSIGLVDEKASTQIESSRAGRVARKAVSLEELQEEIFGTQRSVIVMVPSIAVCMPNSCSMPDIQRILFNALDFAYNKTFEQANRNYTQAAKARLSWPLTRVCHQAKKPDLDGWAIFMIALLAFITALCLGAGIVDYFQTRGLEKPPQRSKPMKYFMAFSLYTNISKWLSTRRSPEDFGCLHGIRFLSTSWVVLCHTFDVFRTSPIIWNFIDVKRIYESRSILAVFNGTYSVDTFFVMSGLLVTYNIMKMLDKSKGKFNVVMFYVHRYLRLTPVYAILVGVGATLLTYMGKGPMWAYLETSEENCRKNWWTNILYVNNLVNTNKMCNGETWYLSNDMQFYILSPFIVYPIWRWPRMGLGLLVIYTILSIIAPVFVVHFGHAPAAMVLTGNFNLKTFVEIYIRPWSRIQTFFVGVWVGFALYKLKGKEFKMPLLAGAVGWAVSIATALAVMFSIQPWFDPNNTIPKVSGLFYAGLSRFAFGVSVAWVMFACIKGYGGLVNSFLSWSAFMPLGRLSYCVYLTSLHLQTIFQSRWPVPIRYDPYTMVNFYFAHLVMSNLVGFICTLLFESPFMLIQRLVFEGR